MKSIYAHLMRNETIIAEVKDYGEVEIYDYDGDSKTFNANQGEYELLISKDDIIRWQVK